MIPFDEAKKILNKRGHNYTDEDVKIIREFIDILTDIDQSNFKRMMLDENRKREISGLNPSGRHPNLLKKVLAKKKISIKELRNKISYPEYEIQNWCDNKNQPDLEILNKIAKALNMDVRELLVKL